MEDDIIDPKSGKPRRHDGKDPWSLLPRDEVLARGDLGDFVPAIPTGEVGAIAPGGYVQVVIVRERNDPQGRYEAVWVEVVGPIGDGWEGTFDNQPTWVRGVAAGDVVRFEQRHVLSTRPPSSYR